MRSRLYSTYFFVIILFLFSAIGGAIYILRLEYDSLIAAVVAALHKNGLEEKLRNQVFTRNRFILLQRISWLVFILAPFCFWLAVRYKVLITGYCKFVVSSVWQSLKFIRRGFQNNTPLQNRWVYTLMAIIAIFFIFRIITSFLNYDEMWSYNYYTASPFYYSFFTYSSYPLFELTTHFFKWLPFSMKINLRLSSFLFGMASCFVLYACLRKYFRSHFIAMAGLAAFAFVPFTIVYSSVARGPVHELFFAIAGLFSFLFWLENTQRKKYLVMYVLAAVLGVYSLSTHILFLLFLLGIGMATLIKTNRPAVVLFFKTNLLIIAGIFILYAPLFLTTGFSVFESLVKSKTSYYNTIIMLPLVIKNILAAYISGYIAVNMIALAAAILILLYVKNKLPANQQLIFKIIVWMPVAVIFFYLITSLPYPGRSVAFCLLDIPLVTCFFAQAAMPWFNKNSIRKKGIAISAIGLALFTNGYFYLPAFTIDKNVAIVSSLLIEKKITSCYDNSSYSTHFFYYYPGIEYYYRQENKNIELTLSAKNSMRYKPLLESDVYDCIVYDFGAADSTRVHTFHELYRDPTGKFKIYIRNTIK